MKRKRKNEGPEGPARQMLESLAGMRGAIAGGRVYMSVDGVPVLDFDGYDRRIDEIERLVRRGFEANARRVGEMWENLSLDMEADTAAYLAEATERIVKFTDLVAHQAEEKKYELSEEEREGLDSILLPYQDGIREEMLGALPMETRRKLEEEKRRLEGE